MRITEIVTIEKINVAISMKIYLIIMPLLPFNLF